MSDLQAIYDQIARPWTHEQLAAHDREARRRGLSLADCNGDHLLQQPLPVLARAIPVFSTLNTAIHVIHIAPVNTDRGLAEQLFGNVTTNSAVALHRCHLALDLDNDTHHLASDEWLPAVYATTAELLEHAGLSRQPPSLVGHAQDAIAWLSRAITDLDDNSPDAASSIVDGLARVLTLSVFADTARFLSGSRR